MVIVMGFFIMKNNIIKTINNLQNEVNKLNLKIDITNLQDSYDLIKLGQLGKLVEKQTENFKVDFVESFYHSYNDIIDIIPEKDYHKWKIMPFYGHIADWVPAHIKEEYEGINKILDSSSVFKYNPPTRHYSGYLYTDFMGCDNFIDKLSFLVNDYDVKIFLIDYERKIINTSFLLERVEYNNRYKVKSPHQNENNDRRINKDVWNPYKEPIEYYNGNAKSPITITQGHGDIMELTDNIKIDYDKGVAYLLATYRFNQHRMSKPRLSLGSIQSISYLHKFCLKTNTYQNISINQWLINELFGADKIECLHSPPLPTSFLSASTIPKLLGYGVFDNTKKYKKDVEIAFLDKTIKVSNGFRDGIMEIHNKDKFFNIYNDENKYLFDE